GPTRAEARSPCRARQLSQLVVRCVLRVENDYRRRNSAVGWGAFAHLSVRLGWGRPTQRALGVGRGVDGEGPAGRAGSDGVGYGGSRRSRGVDRRRGQIPLRGIVSSRKIPPCGIG